MTVALQAKEQSWCDNSTVAATKCLSNNLNGFCCYYVPCYPSDRKRVLGKPGQLFCAVLVAGEQTVCSYSGWKWE